MKISQLLKLFACLTLLTVGIGCDNIHIEFGKKKDNTAPSSNFVNELADTLDDRTKDECLELQALYAGAALYVETNSESLATTDKWEGLIQKVKKQLGWLSEDLVDKDKDFSDRLRKELEALKLGDPKSFDKETTDVVVKVLKDTSEACGKAAKGK